MQSFVSRLLAAALRPAAFCPRGEGEGGAVADAPSYVMLPGAPGKQATGEDVNNTTAFDAALGLAREHAGLIGVAVGSAALAFALFARFRR